MPLALLNEGSSGVITIVKGRESQIKFLENLGFIVNENVTVISNNSGNVIVSIKGSRVALGREMAKKIQIQPL